MDTLDLRLLRAMFPGEVYSIGGLDPAPTIEGLARSTGSSRLTVRRRLASWREEGFWNGLTVFPNPDALGTSLQMQSIMLPAGPLRYAAERALFDLLEPVFLFQTGDFYNPVLLAEAQPQSEARQKRFRDAGIGQVTCPPLEFPTPPSKAEYDLRDWKIVRELRRAPVPGWPAIAREAGITTRSVKRRVQRLTEGRALFYFPVLDFRRLPHSIATVGVLFSEEAALERFSREVVERYPDLLRIESVFPFERMLPPTDHPVIRGRCLFFLPLPSASAAEQLRRDFLTHPGVVEVVIGFPTQNVSNRAPFDVLIEAAIEGAKTTN